ncbi:MAG: dTDP-4-dehydrorhamnose 3,5-epimerase [Bacteroidota bacterium]
MIFKESPLKGCYAVETERFSDSRGWFARTFCSDDFKRIGFSGTWVQHNHSFTKIKGSIRGMHYQKMPACEAKLVRCVAGSVFDVAVDIRPDSLSYLKWYAEELSAENGRMIYIPAGFAHGFQTLTDNAELLYCHSQTYQPEHESGLNYLDELININWPLQVTEVSDRDKGHPFLTINFEGVKTK